tara:strand:- start:22580 stop:23545 length:966 start_codon:yes stop_codon:yes gene_type:complete
MKKIMITGCAGFIGFHLSQFYLKKNFKIVGIDNINNYYDQKLKKDRIKILNKLGKKNFIFCKKDLRNKSALENIFKKYKIKEIFHLAAQAGVRHSLKKPEDYISNNINGYLNILEFSRKYKIKKIFYASTSSVYGLNRSSNISEFSDTNKPIQFYAVTKKTNELMSYAYNKLYNLDLVGLRFFTIYGPWGRPDMALFKFTKNILEHKKIDVHNFGKHSRNFTYIDDAIRAIDAIYRNNDKKFDIYNIASPKSVELKDYIKKIENCLGIKSIQNKLPLQKGDVEKVSANIFKLKKIYKTKKITNVDIGIKKFIDWYRKYYNV